MPASPGYIAVIKIGSSPVVITGIKSVDIKISNDIYDITAFSDGQWKRKITGISDYTMSFSGNLDLSDDQQALLQASLITNPGQSIPWEVYPLGTDANAPKYSGVVLVKDEDIKLDIGSEQQVQFDLEGNGPIVYTPAAA